MFPRWVVMLEQSGKIVRHTFFYNGHNAQRAFRKAEQADEHGFHTLEDELAEANWSEQKAVVKFAR